MKFNEFQEKIHSEFREIAYKIKVDQNENNSMIISDKYIKYLELIIYESIIIKSNLL